MRLEENSSLITHYNDAVLLLGDQPGIWKEVQLPAGGS